MRFHGYKNWLNHRKSNKQTGFTMFLPIWKLFAAIFVYYLILEALKKFGLIKSK